MADIKPPFTHKTALTKVKFAQDMWDTRDPQQVAKGYTKDCIWRNRDSFVKGTDEIVAFLQSKWQKERNYRLRKELFTFSADKIAVQFFYEYQDAPDNMRWKRCYGLENWTFEVDGPEAGKMRKRMMSGNDVLLGADGNGAGKGETGAGKQRVDWVEGRWLVREDGGLMDVREIDGEKVTRMLTERHL